MRCQDKGIPDRECRTYIRSPVQIPLLEGSCRVIRTNRQLIYRGSARLSQQREPTVLTLCVDCIANPIETSIGKAHTKEDDDECQQCPDFQGSSEYVGVLHKP
jgi:hypothetical protein